jgi:hypothetical protein
VCTPLLTSRLGRGAVGVNGSGWGTESTPGLNAGERGPSLLGVRASSRLSAGGAHGTRRWPEATSSVTRRRANRSSRSTIRTERLPCAAAPRDGVGRPVGLRGRLDPWRLRDLSRHAEAGTRRAGSSFCPLDPIQGWRMNTHGNPESLVASHPGNQNAVKHGVHFFPADPGASGRDRGRAQSVFRVLAGGTARGSGGGTLHRDP